MCLWFARTPRLRALVCGFATVPHLLQGRGQGHAFGCANNTGTPPNIATLNMELSERGAQSFPPKRRPSKTAGSFTPPAGASRDKGIEDLIDLGPEGTWLPDGRKLVRVVARVISRAALENLQSVLLKITSPTKKWFTWLCFLGLKMQAACTSENEQCLLLLFGEMSRTPRSEGHSLSNSGPSRAGKCLTRPVSPDRKAPGLECTSLWGLDLMIPLGSRLGRTDMDSVQTKFLEQLELPIVPTREYLEPGVGSSSGQTNMGMNVN